MTDLEELLTCEGQRWRTMLGPDPDLHELMRAAPRRSRLPVILAAALVAVLVAAGFVAFRLARPDKTPAAHGPACADQFRSTATSASGAEFDVRLDYRGATACHIAGLGPLVEFRNRDGTVLGTWHDSSFVYKPPLRVGPGQRVYLGLDISQFCQSAFEISSVRLYLTGDTTGRGVVVPTDGLQPPACPAAAKPGVGARVIGPWVDAVQFTVVIHHRQGEAITRAAQAGTVRVQHGGRTVVTLHGSQPAMVTPGRYGLAVTSGAAACPQHQPVRISDVPIRQTVLVTCGAP